MKKNNNKLSNFQIWKGRTKTRFFATCMNILNSLYFTNRKNNKLTIIKNIKYSENKKCTYDLLYIKNYPVKKLPTVFFIHGGSYVANDKRHFMHFAKDLADKGYLVVNINYRLVPDVYIVDCLHDCQKAIYHVLELCDKIDTNNCFMAGDSAGANLVCQVALSLEEKTFHPCKKISLNALALYYGLYDAKLVSDKLTQPFIDGIYEYKYFDKNKEEFYKEIEILSRITNKFPPSLILTSDNDFIKSNSMAMIEKCQKAGIDYEYIIYKKSAMSMHGFLNIKNTKIYNTSLQGVLEFFETHKKELTKKDE